MYHALNPPPLIGSLSHLPQSQFASYLQRRSHFNHHSPKHHQQQQPPPMASTSALSMAMPLPRARQPTADAFFRPLPLRLAPAVASKRVGKFQVSASLKEKAVAGLTAAALTASMVAPDAAEAAVSPSLKNFLLSIAAGGVVLTAIIGVVVGVSNFDPVKRG